MRLGARRHHRSRGPRRRRCPRRRRRRGRRGSPPGAVLRHLRAPRAQVPFPQPSGIAAALRRSVARASAVLRAPAAEPVAVGQQAGPQPSAVPPGRAVSGPAASRSSVAGSASGSPASGSPAPGPSAPGPATALRRTMAVRRPAEPEQQQSPARPAASAAGRSGSTPESGDAVAGPARPTGPTPDRLQSSAGGFRARQGSRVANLTASVARRFAAAAEAPNAVDQPQTGPVAGGAVRRSAVSGGTSGTSGASGTPSVPAAPQSGTSPASAAEAGSAPGGGRSASTSSSAHFSSADAETGTDPVPTGLAPPSGGSAVGALRRWRTGRPTSSGLPLPIAGTGLLRRAVGPPAPVPTAARSDTIRPAALQPVAAADSVAGVQRAARHSEPAGALPANRTVRRDQPARSATSESAGSAVSGPASSPLGQELQPRAATAAPVGPIRRTVAAQEPAGTSARPPEVVQPGTSTMPSLAGTAPLPTGSTSAGQATPRAARHAAPEPVQESEAVLRPTVAEPAARTWNTGRPLGFASLGRPIRRTVRFSAGTAGSAPDPIAAGAGQRHSRLASAAGRSGSGSTGRQTG